VVDTLHGERIPDPYRWLEDGESAETRSWTSEQNRFTRDYLDGVPARPFIRARLEQLLKIGALSAPTPARGRYFYQRREGTQNQPVLYVRDGVEGPDRVLLDPNALDAAGTTALDWYFPSEDGKLLAYGLSENGSEESVLHVLDVDSGEVKLDRISGTRAADLAWLPGGNGFYYTRYPLPGLVPEGEEQYHRAVFLHLLGDDPAGDRLIFKPSQKEHWPSVDLSPEGRWLLIGVARTFDQTDLFLQDLERSGPLVAVAENLPASFEGQVVRGRLYVRTNLDAPNYRLYRGDPERPDRSRWEELIPTRSDAVLDGAMVLGNALALSYLESASSRLLVTDLEGKNPRPLELPTIGSVFGWGGEWDGEELFYGFSSYTVPPSVYRVDLNSGPAHSGEWSRQTSIRRSYEVRQVTYPSRDGTGVSMFLVHRNGLRLTGDNPTYLTGYGGFNISMTPGFSRSLLLWVERGGLVAVPNLRGGGEYGESWHQAGMLARKQNSFDDFIAAAEWLIAQRYTKPDASRSPAGRMEGCSWGPLSRSARSCSVPWSFRFRCSTCCAITGS
jgi:prolyl oligopeptidase